MAQPATNSSRKRARAMRFDPVRSSGAATTAARGDSPLRFLSAFVRQPLTVGACWPSSPALSRVVVDCCEVRSDAMVTPHALMTDPTRRTVTSPLMQPHIDECKAAVIEEIAAAPARRLRPAGAR